MGVGLTVTVEEILGEIEHAIAGGVVELCDPVPRKEDIERRAREGALREARIQLGGELTVVFDVDFVRYRHGTGRSRSALKNPRTAYAAVLHASPKTKRI